MAKQKRNIHSPEFKAKVALEAVRGVQTVKQETSPKTLTLKPANLIDANRTS